MLANIDAMRDMLTETLSSAEGAASTEAAASFDLASILKAFATRRPMQARRQSMTGRTM
jgi:hypothetical protein